MEEFEVKDSLKKSFIIRLSCLLSPIIILDIIFLIWVIILEFQGIHISLYLVPLLIIFSIPFFLILVTYIRRSIPIQRTRIFISNESIDFFLQDKLFIRLLWHDIEKIIAIKEISYPPNSFAKWINLYFKGPNLNKSIRPYFLGLNHRNENLLLSALEEYAKALQIQFTVDLNKNKTNKEHTLKELDEIKKFLQNCKHL
ncbi:MAG: hypothetical protein ACFFCY_15890 [Promethearchaeota archaeon]